VKEVIEIEKLLHWTYQRQKAHILATKGVGLHKIEARAGGYDVRDISGDGCAAVEWFGHLGVQVDAKGRDRGDIHPDAEAVHEAVSLFKAVDRAQVIEYALSGCRPDPMDGIKPEIAPMLNGKGKPAMIWDDNRNAIGCKLVVVRWQEQIDQARRQHDSWISCLEALVEYFEKYPDALESYLPVCSMSAGE